MPSTASGCWVVRGLSATVFWCFGFVTVWAGGPDVILVGASVFREHAIAAELPRYPNSSLSVGHSGVAVIEVQVSGSGEVTFTRILEAPDPAIANAVASAVRKWSFRPFVAIGDKRPFVTRSRLVFYFRLSGGKPLVIDAAAGKFAAPAK